MNLGAHEFCERPYNRVEAQGEAVLGRSHISHGPPRDIVGSHTISWAPNIGLPWTPKNWESITHLWATTSLLVEPHVLWLDSHVNVWATTRNYGRPKSIVLDTHEMLWAVT